ncbi:MAG: hypothetical protein IAF58_08750 [Leptolyngbya sp.]|nr:hypothetical protein [Candidatus Melainabacteria bacterium]
MRKISTALALTLCLLTSTLQAVTLSVQAKAGLPEAVLRKPVPVIEDSVSTYVPSSVAPGNGLAINIIFPEKPRYKKGAPIVVTVTGNEQTSLSTTLHVANCGFAEVRFAYPGCGAKQFHSDGIFDNFGNSSSTALKDILLFLRGETTDYKGRKVNELIPITLDQSVIGLLGWDTGANTAIITLAKHPDKLSFVSFLAFYEGAVGSMFLPPNLGTIKDLNLNKNYRQGSAATGKILVDYRKLMFAQGARRHPGVAKKRGEAELKGVLYFDENGNKEWDEAAEYAFSYATEVGLDKQIYAPPITEALIRHKVFLKSLPPEMKKPGDSKDVPKTESKNFAQKLFSKDSGEKTKTDVKDGGNKDGGTKNDATKSNSGGSSNTLTKTEAKVKTKAEILRWPNTVATLADSEAYYAERDGSLYIKKVCEAYPKLLVGLFGAKVAHVQRQPDHPHIALLYNAFLEHKPRWMRLNPEPIYTASICRMNVNNFSANAPNSAIDATLIVDHLAPLGLVPEYAWLDALVAELGDRAKSGNLKTPLALMLSDYQPIPDPAKVEAKPAEVDTEDKTDTKKDTVEAKPATKTAPAKAVIKPKRSR